MFSHDKQTTSVPFPIMQVLSFVPYSPKTNILDFRGSGLDTGVPEERIEPQNQSNIETDPSINSMSSLNAASNAKRATFPAIQDIYICNATIPEHAALRVPKEGSLFITAFAETVAKYSHKYDLDELMTLVQTKINDIKEQYNLPVFQAMSYEKRGATKKFFLNPGLYETTKRLKFTFLLAVLWLTFLWFIVKSYVDYYSDWELYLDSWKPLDHEAYVKSITSLPPYLVLASLLFKIYLFKLQVLVYFLIDIIYFLKKCFEYNRDFFM